MNTWVETGYMPAPNHMSLPMQSNAMYGSAPQSQPNARLGPEAVNFLRAHYRRDPKPSSAFKRQLAADLGVVDTKINNWFQNERAKTKQVARQAEQKRLANGESPESQDTARHTPIASSPPMSLSQPKNLPSSRHTPMPLTLTTLRSSSSTELGLDALDLPYQSQNLNFSSPNISSGMMSAPAHITTFGHHTQLPHNFPHSPDLPNWTEHSQSGFEAFSSDLTPSLLIPTPTFGPTFLTEMQQSNLTWPPQFSDATPTSAGFPDYSQFALLSGFEEPLHSAQIDSKFPEPLYQEENFLSEHYPWASLPQLSPSDSHHEQSIVSESLPMTPASFAPESYQNSDDYHEQTQAMFMNSNMQREMSSASPAIYESLSPMVYPQAPSRPSSTQPPTSSQQSTQGSSFTRKRDIKIPHLSIANSAMTMGKATLKPPQSAGLRTPRSPLHPIRDDTRRVSKASAHPRSMGMSVPS